MAFVMSSCSNDDIEITKTGELTLNVSTQSVYDDFSVSDEFKERFLSGSYNIGIYTFIYDKDGNLAASDSVYTQTFGNISQKINGVVTGSYTVVTLEMLVDADNNYQSDNWVIVGKNSLSTLEILNKDYTAYWYSAVGSFSKEIEIVNNENLSVNVVPKGIGAIIHTRMTNFDNSNYDCLSLLTKEQPVGRFFNPSLKGEERFHYDHYNASHTWTTRGYVYPSDGLKNIISPSVYLLEEGNIKCCFGPQKENTSGELDESFIAYPNNSTILSIEDGKIYYGGFHYLGGVDETCTAGFFNTSNQYLKWYNSLPSILVPNLYLSWGGTVTNAQSFMKSYNMTLGLKGQGVLQDNGNYAISFTGKNKVSDISYFFTSKDRGLVEVDVRYHKNNVSANQIVEYLNSAYTLLAKNDDAYMYKTSDSKTVIMFMPLGDYWVVGFIDYEYVFSNNAKKKSCSKLLTAYNNK